MSVKHITTLPGEGWGKTTIRVGDVVKYHDTQYNVKPRGLIHHVKVTSIWYDGFTSYADIEFVKPSKSAHAYWVKGSRSYVGVWWLEGRAK